MNLIMLCVVSLLVTCTYRFWRVVADREVFWELETIRDQLRWLAINDEALRRSANFKRFDYMLARSAQELETYSLWTMFGAKRTEEGTAKAEAFMKQMEADSNVGPLLRRFGAALVRRLQARHWLLLLVCWALTKVFHKRPLPEEAVRVEVARPDRAKQSVVQLAA